ncbi:ArsR/SmtB family transcription factor [Alteribacter populi]|uniref:ArsR/SmtB family transcription factor n=1 Tax=Alteribacter populi TaxID=2011011 RepID=UPI000BBB303F|nr:metalloregulator ArsR/SmtB family transcription factor [Alteribacter populi]
MSKNDTCDVYSFDKAKVSHLKQTIIDSEIHGTSQIFKILADEKRLKVAYALTLEKELCVCDVAHLLQSSTATASHHLRMLKKMGLAKYRKEGKLVFYSLDDDHVVDVIKLTMEHQREGKHHE